MKISRKTKNPTTCPSVFALEINRGISKKNVKSEKSSLTVSCLTLRKSLRSSITNLVRRIGCPPHSLTNNLQFCTTVAHDARGRVAVESYAAGAGSKSPDLFEKNSPTFTRYIWKKLKTQKSIGRKSSTPPQVQAQKKSQPLFHGSADCKCPPCDPNTGAGRSDICYTLGGLRLGLILVSRNTLMWTTLHGTHDDLTDLLAWNRGTPAHPNALL